MPLQPVSFQDFSGGQADIYIGTDVKKGEIVQNLLIDETQKAYVRDGTDIYPTRLPTAASSTRPTGIYLGPEPFSHPVVVVGPHAYVANETAGWTEITGPNTSFLPTKTDSQIESALIWRRQIIAAASATGLPPAMIFSTNYISPSNPDNACAYTARTLGLPALASSPTIHYDTADAYQFVYAFYYKFTFVDYVGTVFAFFGNPNLPALVNGSGSADPGSSNISISAIPVLANTSLTNYDVSSTATTNTTYVSGSTSATVASATGISKGQQLLVSSAYIVPGTVVVAVSGTTITLSQPAVGSATVSTIFTPLTVQIYRTINGGSVLFYDGMVANGTTTFTDDVSDTNIQLRSVIYTSGNALGYDQPPVTAFAVTQTNDIFWYATTKALYQSVSGAPGACPSSFAGETEQKITGLSDIISFPILFCDKSVYRIEGSFDSFGNQGYAFREISKVAGCVSNNSIVKTPYGLVWFGNGGVYHTDGYSVQKISKHLNVSYLIWANGNVSGEYDPTKNMVYWTVNTYFNPNGVNNAKVVLHLNYGLSEESVFTTIWSEANLYPTALRFSLASDIKGADPLISTTGTWTSGTATMVVASADGIRSGQNVSAIGIPYGTTVTLVSGTTITLSENSNQNGSGTAVTFTQAIFSPFYSRMLFTDKNGYLLRYDPNSLTDVYINNAISPVSMAKKTIIYDYTTAGLDQGIVGFRKYNPDVILEVDAATPVAIQIRHRRDDGGGGWSGEGGSPPSGKGVAGSPGGGDTGNPGVPEIRQDGAITWDLTDCLWLDDPIEHLWNDFPTVNGKRSVPAAQLRSGRRQLKFTNSYTIISASDDLGLATVAVQNGQILPTVTLDDLAELWVTDPEGYWITFESDDYNNTYEIVARLSDTVIQLTDPYGTLVAGSTKWEIKGFRKFERPRLLSFTLNAEIEGPTYGQSVSPHTGANA